MIEPSWVLTGAALPALAAAALMAVVCILRRPASASRIGIGWSLSIGAAAVVGTFASHGRPPLPPATSQQWLLAAVVPAAVVATVVGLLARRRVATITLLSRATVAFGAPPLLLLAHLKHYWSTAAAVTWLIVLGLVIFLYWSIMSRLAARRPGRSAVAALFAAVAGTGMVIMLSDSAHIAEITFTLAAATAGALAASFLLPRGSFAHGCVGVIVTAWIGLLIVFWFYVQYDAGPIEAILVILLLTVVPAAWVGEIPAIQRITPIKRTLIRAAVVLAPIVAAVIVAAVQFAREFNQAGPW